jgi:LacI family transcriptional regulator
MNTKPPIPTLHDVAKKADVSTATVSRCLNFPDQVTERTRKKVMEAIRHLGYSPNFGAKAMAARRTNTIGAIIPTMENAIFARGLQAFQEELRSHGYTMLVASTSYQPEIEEEQIRTLVRRGADALLLIGHDRDPEIYRFLERQGVPALITWAFDPALPRPSVGFNNRTAMQNMATEVLQLGHRKIALISAETVQNDRARARRVGIQDAMIAAGQNPNDLHIIETNYGIENGAVAFEQIITSEQTPTAVFCGNDVLAVGALRRAREMGISVPNQVSIIGFDDIELAQVAYPPLTTVHVPHREMGQRAAQALISLLQDGILPSSIELFTKLVFRGTLGPAKPPQN